MNINTKVQLDKQEDIDWKKELFTNPDIKDTNIICIFKLSRKTHGENKLMIASTCFLNRRLILGERNLIILAKLIQYYDINYTTVIVIVRNDVGKDSFYIGDYKWQGSKFRIIVHIVRYKTFFDRLFKKNDTLDSEKEIIKIIIFQDYSWSEILFLFKSKGIIVSGGDVVRRHSLSYNQYKLSLFIHLINIMNNYYINKAGIVLKKNKDKNNNIIYGDEKYENYSKEMYDTSFLDFRDARFKAIMRSQIDFTNKKLSSEIDLFLEYLKNKDDFLKYMENKKDNNMNLNISNIHKDNKYLINKNKQRINNQDFTNKGDKREYHQSSVLRENNKNQLRSYFDLLENIINKESLTPKQKQADIEEE